MQMEMDTFEEYNNKGLTGLCNLGNTCFMNATLQCLSHTYELNDFLDNSEFWQNRLNDIPDSLILWEWDKLRKLIWSENCIIEPKGFLQAVHKVATIKNKVLFTGYAQNDLTEFLDFCMNCFHNSLHRDVDMVIKGDVVSETDEIAKKCFEMMRNMYKTDYSEFLKLFYGISVSKIVSESGTYKNITPEPFFNICVPMTDGSLYDCLKLYTSVEELTGDNQLYNEKTKEKEDAKKRIMFWSLPDILVITLKRFNNNARKDQRLIDFELENFDLSDLIVGYDKESYVYDLYGICNHSGGTLGGHYTSFIKNNNRKWYHCNDTNVSEVAESTLKTPKAYCFFYRKKK
tara:strand:- start:1869 stop:2903 length:1035 start_codon:yes stop_codon:yes gene_type:complete